MDEPVSIRAYARDRKRRGLPGASHPGIAKAVATGRLVAPAVLPDGRIDPVEADAQLAEHLPETGAVAVTEPRSLGEIRREREALKLRREHLATIEAEGLLMVREDVRRACTAAGLLLKQRLEAMPDRLAGRLAGLEPHAMHAVLTAECRDLLDDFRAALAQVGGREDANGAAS